MKLCRDKRCERSGQLLPLAEFTFNRRNDGGLSEYCCMCSRRRNRESYRTPPGIKARKRSSIDQSKVIALVTIAIRDGHRTRERIETETRLNEEVIADALAELYDRNQITIVSGHYYPRAA